MAEASDSRARRVARALSTAATHNLPLKLVSLAIAVGLWAFVNLGERDSEEAIKVPVELRQIPSALMITSPRVDSVDLRVVGPRTLLGRIDHNQLTLPLDLGGAQPGPAVFTVNVERLNLPRGVRVVRVTPAEITVTLEAIGRKVVPVELKLEGTPPEDFSITSTAILPTEVELTGPESQVDPIESVTTEVVRLGTDSRAPIQRDVPIEPLGEYVKPKPGAVAVDIQIAEVLIDVTLESVVVGVMATAAGEVQIEPAHARLTLRGPRRVVEKVTPAGLLGVDAARLDVGAHILSIIPNLPEEATLVDLDPKEVTVTVVAPTPPPEGDAPSAPNPEPLGAR